MRIVRKFFTLTSLPLGRTLFILSLVLSLCLISAKALIAQSNASRLIAQLAIKDGLLIVDREHSQFDASPEFRNRLKIPIERARKILYDDLDGQLATLGRPYHNALTDADKQLDDEGKLNGELTNEVRTRSLGWAEYRTLFNNWAAKDPNRNVLELTMSVLVNAFEGFSNETSLAFDSTDVTLWQVDLGRATFIVIDPINDWNSGEYSITLPDAATGGTISNAEEIKKEALAPLLGRLWRSSDIRTRIEIFYARRGLTPIITLSSSAALQKTISIRESLRIARLILPVTIKDEDIDKILYLLLNDKQFHTFRKNRKDILSRIIEIPDQPSFRAIDFTSDLKSGDPYVNTRTQQIQQLQLADVGYVLTNVPTLAREQPEGLTYVDIVIKKQADVESPPKGSPEQEVKPTDPTATDSGVITAEHQEREAVVQPPRTAAWMRGGKPAPANPVPEAETSKERKNYLGGGFEYRPGQGVKAFGLYQRSKFELLSNNDKFSIKVGGQEKALGSINYNSDFIQFRRLPFRLGAQLTGSSDFTANRFFNGVSVDERRTGGLASLKFQFFRDKRGSLLQIYVEGRNATVTLKPEKSDAIKSNLNTIDVGALYFYQSAVTSRHSRMIRIAPRLRFGLGLAQTEHSFKKFSLLGEINQELPSLLALNVRGRLELTTSNTPLFEQPSLGGTEVLRGFRQDDAIGRRLWTFQNELKLPIPGTGNAIDGIGLFLQQKVRLAGFFDIGNVYQTTSSSSGLRRSPGVGIRLAYYPIEVGVDWAYGFGPAATTGHGRGRIALSVRTFLPE
jgi:hypothetical protein